MNKSGLYICGLKVRFNKQNFLQTYEEKYLDTPLNY